MLGKTHEAPWQGGFGTYTFLARIFTFRTVHVGGRSLDA